MSVHASVPPEPGPPQPMGILASRGAACNVN